MSTATAALHDAPKGRRFHFDGVLVDEASARLFVDGRERLCSQRAMRLIVVMCEAQGQVLPKQQVIDRLWPGGQIVSDEALTQAVFRARACLDRYANRLVTVRGIGLRLDAQVRCEEAETPLPPPLNDPVIDEWPAAPKPAPEPATLPAAPEALSSPPETAPAQPQPVAATHAPRLFRVTAMLLALLAAVVLWQLWPTGTDTAPLDVGYGLLPEDAHAQRADSLPLLREAFTHEAQGDRSRARALLETVHASDASTPLPAMFLSLWAIGAGDAPTADRWLEQARARLQPLTSPPLTALLRYTEAEREHHPQDILRYAGAVLDQRPEAWQMRLARVHLLLNEGLRDAALDELRRIQMDTLSHRKLAMALADRASLGDPDGAEAIFARIGHTTTDPSTHHWTLGRFAWARGDLDAARAAFADAEQAARREARFNLEHRAISNLGVIAMLQSRFGEAIALMERAREGMIQNHWTIDEIDLSLMLSQLHALEGDMAAARADLDRAQATAASNHAAIYRDLTRIQRARLFPDAPVAEPEPDSEPALAPLLAAWAAVHSGDMDGARHQYATAQRRVAQGSQLHDETRLLAVRLGLPPDPALKIDPPYPPLARLSTRVAAERLAAQGDAP